MLRLVATCVFKPTAGKRTVRASILLGIFSPVPSPLALDNVPERVVRRPDEDPLTRKSFPRIAATFSWMVSRAEAPGCSFDDGESQG
jgi:hypothetical protein